MAQAKAGDTVRVHYTGRLDDGTVFDSSRGREPLEFTIGSGSVIPGFEQAVVGMAPGESKRETVPADQAYGAYDENLVFQVGRDGLPDDLEPEVGQELAARTEAGQIMRLTVREVDEAGVTLDANHPLAGKDLTFDIELVEIC